MVAECWVSWWRGVEKYAGDNSSMNVGMSSLN